MFWGKAKPASAEISGHESKQDKRLRRFVPVSVAAAAVSLAIAAGCGETDSKNTEKLPEKSAVPAKIKKARERITKGMAKELRPVAVDIARRAIKISADQEPNVFSAKQSTNISRLYSNYPGGPTTPLVTIVGHTEESNAAAGFYIDVGKTQGKLDPRKVDLINLSVLTPSKLAKGMLENDIDIYSSYKDYRGQGYPWGGSSFLDPDTKDKGGGLELISTCYPPYIRPSDIQKFPSYVSSYLRPDEIRSSQDACVVAAQGLAVEADIMFTNIVEDIQR